MSESLDHEVRPFGIRVVIIEPSYIRTKFAGNSKTVATDLPEYREMRRRASAAFAEHTANGDDPGLVADAIARAATTGSPRLRYPVGRQAKLLTALRSLAPSGLLDRGIRRNFGIDE